MSLKEAQEKVLSNVQRWQKIENAGIASTGKIMEKTDNPLVRLIMEVIQRDSQMHHRVQEFIADSLAGKAYAMTPEDLATVWGMIEEHVKLERSTLELAKESIKETSKAKGMMVQHYLLRYLEQDEMKHEEMLIALEKIKSNMYPYG